MKRVYYLTFAFSFLYSNCFAQTIKVENITPKTGTSVNSISLENDLPDLGEAGINNIWDFKHLTRTDTTTLFYVDPKLTPYHNHFLYANLVVTIDNQNFDYFHFTDSSYCFLGSSGYAPENDKARLTKYDSCKNMMKTPIILNDSLFSMEKRYIKIDGRFDVYCLVRSTMKADAHGTIITEGDTLKQAMRYKRFTEFYEYMTDYTNYAYQKQTELKYNWFINDFPMPVFSIDISSQFYKGDTNVYESMSLAQTHIKQNNIHPFDFYLSLSEDGMKYVFHVNRDAARKRKLKLHTTNKKGEELVHPISIKLNKKQTSFDVSAAVIESKQNEGVFVFTLFSGKEKLTLYYYLVYPIEPDLFESEIFDTLLNFENE